MKRATFTSRQLSCVVKSWLIKASRFRCCDIAFLVIFLNIWLRYAPMRVDVFLLMGTVLLLLGTVGGQHRVCNPGSTFKVACNTCRCSFDGTDMACTRKLCSPEHSGIPGAGGGSQGNRVCRPGSFFKVDCNDCRCNDDGTNAACTLRGCLT